LCRDIGGNRELDRMSEDLLSSEYPDEPCKTALAQAPGVGHGLGVWNIPMFRSATEQHEGSF
jgi:hypothetical protein